MGEGWECGERMKDSAVTENDGLGACFRPPSEPMKGQQNLLSPDTLSAITYL